MEKSVKRFEWSDGLDTALYKKYLYPVDVGGVGRQGHRRYTGPIFFFKRVSISKRFLGP